MIRIECSGLTEEEQLALALSMSDEFRGRGLALARGDEIVIDQLEGPKVTMAEVMGSVQGFILRRDAPNKYKIKGYGETVVISSPRALEASRRSRFLNSPPGTLRCPACGVVLPDEGRYNVHLKTHDLIR